MEQWNWDSNPSLSESQTCPSFPPPQPAAIYQCWPQESCPWLQVKPIFSQSLSPCREPCSLPQLPITPSLPSPPRTQGISLLHSPCPPKKPPLPSSHSSPLTGHGHEHGKGSEDPSQALAAEEEGAVGGRHGAQLPKEAALQNCTEGCRGTRMGAATQLGRRQGPLEQVSAGCTEDSGLSWQATDACYSAVTPPPIHSSSEVHP